MIRPELTDIQTSTTVFYPGDRVLARVSCDLSLQQYGKLERTIQRFARVEVRVLIVNCLKVRIVLNQGVEEPISRMLVSPKDATKFELGVANLDCSIVDLKPNDQLLVFVPSISSDLQKKYITEWVKRWTGPDVDVRVLEGSV